MIHTDIPVVYVCAGSISPCLLPRPLKASIVGHSKLPPPPHHSTCPKTPCHILPLQNTHTGACTLATVHHSTPPLHASHHPYLVMRAAHCMPGGMAAPTSSTVPNCTPPTNLPTSINVHAHGTAHCRIWIAPEPGCYCHIAPPPPALLNLLPCSPPHRQ